MPVLSHSLEYYAKLWQDACDRGHGSSSHTHEEASPGEQAKVQGSVLLASGRARPPTPPRPKSSRSDSTWLTTQTGQAFAFAINETSNQVQQDRVCLEEEGLPRLSRVHSVTLSSHFRGLWPWLACAQALACTACTGIPQTESTTEKHCFLNFSAAFRDRSTSQLWQLIYSPGQSAAA